MDNDTRQICEAILEDIADGTVPVDVESFSQLHDFVDANVYLMVSPDFCKLFEGAADDSWIPRANEITESVDRWIRAGGAALPSFPSDATMQAIHDWIHSMLRAGATLGHPDDGWHFRGAYLTAANAAMHAYMQEEGDGFIYGVLVSLSS